MDASNFNLITISVDSHGITLLGNDLKRRIMDTIVKKHLQEDGFAFQGKEKVIPNSKDDDYDDAVKDGEKEQSMNLISSVYKNDN